MSRALVELDGIAFTYPGGEFSLRFPHLKLQPGERVACIGPSGSGKTTLVNLIAGIALPSTGRVRVGDDELTELSDAQRRARRIAKVGLVFQQLELLHYLSALDNILLPFRVSELPLTQEVRERARSLAVAMGLERLLGRPPGRLSQGERQRVALCRALVTRPELILGDEPTGNLDPDTATRILDLLFEQAERSGAALLMVTHDHTILSRFDRTVDLRELVERPA
ncbi:MAG: ABC transporter ATP-binding protein [Planctomycetota bacterium]